MDTELTVVDVARVCHDANRAMQINAGEEPDPAWDDTEHLQQWQVDQTINGILDIGSGVTPEYEHEKWRAMKVRAGWTYGPVKDADKKTSPFLVPYDKLPEIQKRKDALRVAIVQALLGPLK